MRDSRQRGSVDYALYAVAAVFVHCASGLRDTDILLSPNAPRPKKMLGPGRQSSLSLEVTSRVKRTCHFPELGAVTQCRRIAQLYAQE